MSAILLIFIYFMVWKDLAYAPFPYGLRAVAQILCLVAGLLVIVRQASPGMVARYWPVLAYLLVILSTAPASDFPWFVLLQGLSLASAVVFAIGYRESSVIPWERRYDTCIRHIVVAYGIACTLSLVLVLIRPSLVYGSMFAGDIGDEIRFRGLMSKAGMMAAAGGILAGFALMGIKRRWLQLPLLAAGVLCVVLTQSRSFWVAALGAFFITGWMYRPRLRMPLLAIAGTFAAGLVLMLTSAIHLSDQNFARFARLESVTTLTGRTSLWEQSLAGLRNSPWIGFGFTLGSTGLPGNGPDEERTLGRGPAPTDFSRQTMHNGYIQVLMDSGLIGFFFYCATIVVSISRVIHLDVDRRYPALLYGLTFLSISNLGESVIYSGSVFHSLAFWLCAVFACGLSRGTARAVGAVVVPRTALSTTGFGNLMR